MKDVCTSPTVCDVPVACVNKLTGRAIPHEYVLLCEALSAYVMGMYDSAMAGQYTYDKELHVA